MRNRWEYQASLEIINLWRSAAEVSRARAAVVAMMRDREKAIGDIFRAGALESDMLAHIRTAESFEQKVMRAEEMQ